MCSLHSFVFGLRAIVHHRWLYWASTVSRTWGGLGGLRRVTGLSEVRVQGRSPKGADLPFPCHLYADMGKVHRSSTGIAALIIIITITTSSATITVVTIPTAKP